MKCGKELSEEAKFCPQCGSTVEEAKEDTPSASEEASETPAVTIAEMEEQAQTAVAVEEKPEEQAEETTETPVQQAETNESISLGVYGEDVEVPVKKSRKGVIIGASAAVVVAGAAALGYFCFSNEIMHLFMGDAGFAGMVEGNSIEYISGGEMDTDEMDKLMADYAEQLFYGAEAEETQLTKPMIDSVLDVSGDSSVTIKTELTPGMILALADSDGMFDMFNLEMAAEMVKGDDCDRISYWLNENGGRTIGADVFIGENDMAMLIPELTSKTFVIQPEEKEADEAVKEKQEFSEKEMKRLREGVIDIYKNTLKNTEIEFTKGGTDLVIADSPIDSERVIIRFSAENLNAMLKEMGDFLRNDEYLRNYYVEATGEEITEYEKIFDETEYDINAQLTIETYITDHAKVTGKKFILTHTDPETSETLDMTFETTLGNCDLYMGDDEFAISFTQRAADETSGIMELTFDSKEENAPLVIEINYSDVGVAEYCGQPVNTGTYVLKLSEKDKLIDKILEEAGETDDTDATNGMGSMDLSSLAEMFKDIEIVTSVKCDGSSVDSSFAIDMPMLFKLSVSAVAKPLENAEKPVMPDMTDAVIFSEDTNIEDYPGLSEELQENLLILAEKSELIGAIMDLAGL